MMVMKNRICSTLLMIFLVLAAQAQLMDPVHFTSRWNMTGETAGESFSVLLLMTAGTSIPPI